jgi:hypothetical protein
VSAAAFRRDQAFIKRLLKDLSFQAKRVAKPHVPSRALRSSLDVLFEGTDKGGLYIPHYWAVYIHDGRTRGFGPRRTTYLVWFTNPKDDPRLRGGYPRRAREIRRLDEFPGAFQHGLRRNAQRRARGLKPFMVVTKFQPRPLAPSYFFTGAHMKRFEANARFETARRFAKHAEKQLKGLLVLETDIARITL